MDLRIQDINSILGLLQGAKGAGPDKEDLYPVFILITIHNPHAKELLK